MPNSPIRRMRRGAVPATALFLLPLFAGCQQFMDGATENTQVLGVQVSGSGVFTPEASTPVTFDGNGKAFLGGTILGNLGVDAFDLGPCAPGDRFEMSFVLDAGFDAVAALFDANSNLVMLNDDSFQFQAPRAPYVDFTARSGTDHLYLAVTTSPKSGSFGGYSIDVTRTAVAAPAPSPAVVVMDWNGVTGVMVGGFGPTDVPAFQGAFIDASFAGNTQDLINRTMDFVRHDFAGLNVSFYKDGDAGIPGGPRSTVYFGTFSAALLGLADSVDYYNGVTNQQAIIYTDSFALFMPLSPTVDEMAQALANVASHEVGHLLGLNHTIDPVSVMDITATAYQLMQDEAFRRSPINATVFPMGNQHAVELLLDTVGGTADPNAGRLAGGVVVSQDELKEARRAWIGAVQIRKDLFCGLKCGQ